MHNQELQKYVPEETSLTGKGSVVEWSRIAGGVVKSQYSWRHGENRGAWEKTHLKQWLDYGKGLESSNPPRATGRGRPGLLASS